MTADERQPECTCGHLRSDHRAWPSPASDCLIATCSCRIFVVSGGIFDGYRIEETDEYVGSMGTRFLRRRAEALVRNYPPELPSYSLRIEKIGPFTYEVAAYQNKLVKI